MNESYKQIYATEKYVDDAINLTSQADWNQNDSTAQDYVKNRTHYADLQYISTWLNYYEVNPLAAGIGIHPLVIAMEGKEDFSFDRFLEREYLRTILSVKITFTVASYGEMDFTDTFFKQIEFIDDYNYKSLLNSVQGYEIYCIRDVTALSEQYSGMFTANGAYLRVFQGTGELKASRVAFRCLKFNQLDERYIPDTIARTNYVDEKITETIPAPATASVGQTIKVSAVDENGKPTAWEATDFPKWEKINEFSLTENALTVLMDTDMEGNAFELSKMRVYMYLPQIKNTSGENGHTGYADYKINGQGRYMYPSSDWSNSYFTWTIEITGEWLTVNCIKGNVGEPGVQNIDWHNAVYKNENYGGVIKSFLWSVFSPNNDKPSAMAGATFSVWGIRA